MANNIIAVIDIKLFENMTYRAIADFGIENLMDYTIDSNSGCDLEDFYKTIVETVLNEEIFIEALEISDGKYEISFEFENKDRFYIISKAWDDVETILQNLMENVITKHLKGVIKKCA